MDNGTNDYDQLNQQPQQSIPVGDAANQVDERHRELIFQVEPGRYTSFLKFKDEQHTWYNIPLGQTPSRTKDSRNPHHNILIPVIPLVYHSPDCDPVNAIAPPPGYLYVFWGDYLWRELEVMQHGYVRDVNLRYYQGRDQREATVERDTRILLPYKMANQAKPIWLCYSNIQWSWARINAMGGMNPKDVRYDPHLQTPLAQQMGVDKTTALKNRQQRMQQIDLSGYDMGFPNTPPQGHRARIENSQQPSATSYHLRLHHKSNIPVIYLHDPLGIARQNVTNYYLALMQLTHHVNDIQQKPHFKSALMSYHTFFNEDLWAVSQQQHGRMATMSYEQQDDGAKLLRDTAKHIDKPHLQTLLDVKGRKTLRQTIRDMKTVHVQWLQGQHQSQPLRDSHSDFISVDAALLDYAALPAPDYILLWSALHELIHFIGLDPSAVDGALDHKADIDAPQRDDDIGLQYLASLLEPSHPLHPVLFPSAQQIDVYSEADTPTNLAPEPANATGDFRPAAYAASMVPSLAQRGTWKIYDDVLKSAERLISDIVNIYRYHWEQAMVGQSQVEVTALVRLMKASRFPDLKGLRLVKPGSPLNNAVVLSGNVTVLAHLQAQQANSQVLPIRQTGFIEVVDPHSKKTIGYMDPHQLPNNHGAPTFIDRNMWHNLFVRNEQGVAKAKVSLVVVSSDARYAQDWHHPGTTGQSTIRRTNQGIVFASKVLPAAVAVMEVFNLVSVTSELFAQKNKTSKKMLEFGVALIGLSHATVSAAVALSSQQTIANLAQTLGSHVGAGMDQFTSRPQWQTRLAKAGHFSIAGKVKIFNQQVPVLGVASAGLAGVGSIFASWDAANRFRADDIDAAGAHTVQAVAMAGLTAALLLEGSVFLGLGPVGWALLTVGILAGVTAYLLTDTPIETWAKHGPFGNGNGGKVNPDGPYANDSAAQIQQTFMSLLMAPRLRIQADPATSPKTIVVTAIAPGFEPGKSAITLHTTYQSQYRMSNGEQAQAIRAGYASAQQISQMAQFIPQASQQVLPCIKWEPVYATDGRQQIGVKYYYQLPKDTRPGSVRYQIRSRVQHIVAGAPPMVVPTQADKPVPASYTDQIDASQNGWAYHEITIQR